MLTLKLLSLFTYYSLTFEFPFFQRQVKKVNSTMQLNDGPDTLLTGSCLTLKGKSKICFLYFLPFFPLFSNQQVFKRGNQMGCCSHKWVKQIRYLS